MYFLTLFTKQLSDSNNKFSEGKKLSLSRYETIGKTIPNVIIALLLVSGNLVMLS